MKKKASELRVGDRIVVTVAEFVPRVVSRELDEVVIEGGTGSFTTDESLVEVLPPGYDEEWHSPAHVGKMRMMLREQYICPDCLRHLTGDGMGIPFSEACKCKETK